MNQRRITKLDPEVADEVPWSESITSYDEEHLITYLRLLDAETDGAEWAEAAREVLHRDPEAEPGRAHCCWTAHMARARWISAQGYRHLLDQVASPSEDPVKGT
ncbi:hypothetical protein AZA_87159 [Nitrospirillum viridazoti Y2]|uniref:DUF2285 domain-containing protein n=1 Tax=Nitrospirillum viridazoti TaxID=3144925 RepID=UPI0002265840|nr:DUF2285 domain-containing protein [Nitrospirillum amazonense]EGY02478.1 hypothetical protein AZA_87159 [Nitrospirillum amazonense Y2]